MGAIKIAVIDRNATPLNKAKNEANSFAATVVIGVTGPIPVRIMAAL